MSFSNTEQNYGNASLRVNSGTKGVLTGQGVLFSVVLGINSGAGASGIVAVFDSISGVTNFASGSSAPVLFFTSGGGAQSLYAPQPFFSGLNVSNVSGAGLFVTITYRTGM